MKINPNAPAYPVADLLDPQTGCGIREGSPGIPIRLAIAAQIMAAQASAGWAPFAADNRHQGDPGFRADRSLEWADALIDAHNRGQS